MVFETAYNTNENLLICAPTGAGKTNIAMLTVLHEIRQHLWPGGVIKKDEFKVWHWYTRTDSNKTSSYWQFSVTELWPYLTKIRKNYMIINCILLCQFPLNICKWNVDAINIKLKKIALSKVHKEGYTDGCWSRNCCTSKALFHLVIMLVISFSSDNFSTSSFWSRMWPAVLLHPKMLVMCLTLPSKHVTSVSFSKAKWSVCLKYFPCQILASSAANEYDAVFLTMAGSCSLMSHFSSAFFSNYTMFLFIYLFFYNTFI